MTKYLWSILAIALLTVSGAGWADAPTKADGSEEEALTEPSAQNTCYITLTCPVGDEISCSDANNQCSSGDYWVECGGTRTYCPPCTVWTECKYNQPEVWCSSQVGDCHVDYLFGVYCDGEYTACGEGGPAL